MQETAENGTSMVFEGSQCTFIYGNKKVVSVGKLEKDDL